ncbi:hypothetical protein [Streptomyces sp. NPDC005209]|uniref:hypothetical protein n=1 Tax=Streptomyces sp. NPDC005209 TaxID=3156715 RepID=UPI0033A64F74
MRLDSAAGPLRAGRLLVVTGRQNDPAEPGLGSVGLDPAVDSVPMGGHLRSAGGPWAVGDITGHGAFTHVSMHQARIAVRDVLGSPGPDTDHRALPRVTVTVPEIAAPWASLSGRPGNALCGAARRVTAPGAC